MRLFSPSFLAIAAAALAYGQTTTYVLVFDNLTAAINGLDFITFGLVETVHGRSKSDLELTLLTYAFSLHGLL